MASIPESRPFRGPWIIAGCFVTFGVASGFPYYNIAFFFDYFRTDHGWTQQAITLGAPIAVLLTIWAGPVIVPLCAPCKSGAQGKATVDSSVLNALESGRAYVNVHTKKNPAGEIRGQLGSAALTIS